MSEWPTAALGEIFDIARGGSPRPIDEFITADPAGVNWIMISDATEGSKYITSTKKRIRPEGAQRSRQVKPGDFLLTNSMSFGKPYIMRTDGCIHDGWLVLSPRYRNIDADFFYYLLGSNTVYSEFERRASGATVKNLNIDLVRGVKVSFPPLREQGRIAEVLNKADALRTKRRAALAQLDTLTQSIFLDMFGDPVENPKRWPMKPLGDSAIKFSDGPFGSNLKSSHYTETGVRVVRLQNIGVGEFLNSDVASISADHFSTLRKHECLPGDVLVGTLGDPNLRACIQPDWLPVALNKADCVQIRSDPRVATAEFLCALLNQPATERMAHELMRGQTRVRISMGRLRNLFVPMPPVALQRDFARRVLGVEQMKAAERWSLQELTALFHSLQHRAFRGEL
jgi:type I restriction enzyme S subunit